MGPEPVPIGDFDELGIMERDLGTAKWSKLKCSVSYQVTLRIHDEKHQSSHGYIQYPPQALITFHSETIQPSRTPTTLSDELLAELDWQEEMSWRTKALYSGTELFIYISSISNDTVVMCVVVLSPMLRASMKCRCAISCRLNSLEKTGVCVYGHQMANDRLNMILNRCHFALYSLAELSDIDVGMKGFHGFRVHSR
jgi:hypothetical protein